MIGGMDLFHSIEAWRADGRPFEVDPALLQRLTEACHSMVTSFDEPEPKDHIAYVGFESKYLDDAVDEIQTLDVFDDEALLWTVMVMSGEPEHEERTTRIRQYWRGLDGEPFWMDFETDDEWSAA